MITSSQVDIVYLDPKDNICVAARHLNAGEIIHVDDQAIELKQDIRIGHKIAVRGIEDNSPVFKYGQPIGITTGEIAIGEHVHVHNLKNNPPAVDYQKATLIPENPAPITDRTFMGYRRPNGKAGTRNYIGVISSVNCSASVAKYIARHFDDEKLKDYPNVDGVVAFAHGWGCGMKFGGLLHEMLNRVLGGIARHPNIGAYLIVGLGCEQSTIGYLVESQQLVMIDGMGDEPKRPPVFSMQDEGGTAKTVEKGVKTLAELLPIANSFSREPIPAGELVVGLECGGSDGNSGITANPAVGVASDLLVRCGGTAVLSEMPEIYGAEHLLTERSQNVEVADKLLERIDWWQWYVGMWGDDIDNNPTMGNKEGGLTTIAEKSLGAVAKGGTTVLKDVYQYAEPIKENGFVIMDTPGFDPPSVTGMVAGGCNVVVFTTGRGSCYGCKPTPSIKVASNTPMYERMVDDMDVNAGTVLHGNTVQQVGEEIFEKIISVASGEQTKSEEHGIGDEEFVIWTLGAQL